MYRISASVAVAFLLAIPVARAADWPAYGHDARRSHVTDEPLGFPLVAAWSHLPAQPPRPSWPEPRVEMHRLDFDYAFQPVVAAGRVFFGSSADDTVRALDLASGDELWRFTADAPVRHAPHIADGRCFAAADDGMVYCLDASTGKPLWTFRAALNERRLLGNDRMISRWPCRTGGVVDNGVVYVAAGMWPADGVFVYALDADDGELRWCNDTSGGMFMSYPHGGSLAIGGVSPQGYLLASEDRLLVPTGRSVPAAFDRADGRYLYVRTSEHRADGGWRTTIAGDYLYGPTHANRSWPMSVRSELFGPRPGDGTRRYSLETGLATGRGRDDGPVHGTDVLPERHFVVVAEDVVYAAGNGKVEALIDGKPRWQAEHGRVHSLARAGNVLVVGGADTVAAFDLGDGSMAWEGAVDGQARGLAIAGGYLVVATHTGEITAFTEAGDDAAGGGERRAATVDQLPAPPAMVDLPGVDLGRLTAGYALVVGSPETADGLVETLVQRTGLHVVRLVEDEVRLAHARTALLARRTLYGSRVTVHRPDDRPGLAYPDFFANLVVVTDAPPAGPPATELYRVLRPTGGIMIAPGRSAADARALYIAAGAPLQEIREVDDVPMVVRGKLPGARDWDSETRSDQRLKWPMELLWFGGPGPARMPNRHGAVMPVTANGRYFVVGNHHLIGVDAYNGVELWSREIRNLLRDVGVLAADDDTVYLHLADHCQALDAQTGVERRRYRRDDASWDELPARARAAGPMPETAPTGTRRDPLTGSPGAVAYKRAYGCGSAISAATMHFFRSGTLGLYDLEDDSGLRNFSGTRPACALSMVPAMGLLIANEGSGGCTCSYNFHTSFAMAPAHHRSNEDWAVFFANPIDGITRHAALNLGAPGDRRDADRLLWLGLPRPSTGLKIDCQLDIEPGLGADRINVDRRTIAGTDRPWVYGSAICGLRRLELALEPLGRTVSLETAKPPAIDGRLDDPAWDGRFPLPVNDETSTVYLRHDAEALYLAYRRPAEVDRRGRVTPWRQDQVDADAPVWEDDSCELVLSDGSKALSMHLGMSASGARYDGLWTRADPYPVYDVPQVAEVAIDGDGADWTNLAFQALGMTDQKGMMRRAANFDPTVSLAWSREGLLMLVDVRDDAVVEYPAQAAMWRKDSIEIFMAEGIESPNRFHLCVGPGVDGKQPAARTFFWDRRTEKPGLPLSAEAVGARTAYGYRVELLLPWHNLGIAPDAGREVALQVMVNDADTIKGGGRDWFRAAWHPDGHTGFKRRALHRLRLADKASPPVRLARGTTKVKAGLVPSVVACDIAPIDLPKLDGIAVDGELNDWEGRGFRQQSLAGQDGTMRHAQSFDPSFQLGWNEHGLLLAARVRDQAVVIAADAGRLWEKDSIEIFLSPKLGSGTSAQLTLAPPSGDEVAPLIHRWTINGKPADPAPATVILGRRTTDGYEFELSISWEDVRIRSEMNAESAMQIFFNDADTDAPYPGDSFRVAWYPQGHAAWNAMAFHRVRLTTEPSPTVAFARGPRVNNDLVRAAEPFPWPLPLARRGAAGEDSQWEGEWTGSVVANDDAFSCELAVPWASLTDAGIDRDGLIIDFSHRGPITEAPSYSFVSVDFRETAASPPRPYTVRLHFAEPYDLVPGDRVFDVALQGRTVLSGFDVVREATGPRRALVKEFTDVSAATRLVLEFTSPQSTTTWTNAPILNGVEIFAESTAP